MKMFKDRWFDSFLNKNILVLGSFIGMLNLSVIYPDLIYFFISLYSIDVENLIQQFYILSLLKWLLFINYSFTLVFSNVALELYLSNQIVSYFH